MTNKTSKNTIKLSENTIKILENYSSINPNLRITPGNNIRTMNVDKSQLSEALIEEEFPTDYAIYDLKEFLSTVAMFESPALTFNNEVVTISDENDESLKTFYYSADLSIVPAIPPMNPEKVPLSAATFTLTDLSLKRLRRAASTLTLKNLKLEAHDGVLNAVVFDKKGANNNRFSITLDNDWVGVDFCVTLPMEKINVVGGDYMADILQVTRPDCDPVFCALKMSNTSQKLFYIISFDME